MIETTINTINLLFLRYCRFDFEKMFMNNFCIRNILLFVILRNNRNCLSISILRIIVFFFEKTLQKSLLLKRFYAFCLNSISQNFRLFLIMKISNVTNQNHYLKMFR